MHPYHVLNYIIYYYITVLSKKLNAKRRALAAYITVYEFS